MTEDNHAQDMECPYDVPDGVETFEKNGEWWGKDEHGEFPLDAGSTYPLDREIDDLKYEPCNAVLKFTYERYGETRYCRAMAESNFKGDDGSEFCKHHKSREALRMQNQENFKTGAFVQSYGNLYKYFPPEKKVVAIEMFNDLLEQSKYDFEVTKVDEEIDLTDANWFDEDYVTVSFPLPTKNVTRSKALWFAALNFMQMESINEQLFAEAFENNLAVGEKEGVVASTEQGPIYDTMEHHLNLPMNRLVNAYSKHLAFGGVDFEKESESTTNVENNWVVFDGPDGDTGDYEASEEDMDDFDFPVDE